MVTEMTSLQGIIGSEYALRSGEHADVATGIGEQYRTVPQTKIGLAVALADRLDSLVGLFAAGLAPTGAKDPFGLRRAAIGVVQPLIKHEIDFDLAEAVKKSAKTQPIEVSHKVQEQILDFFKARLFVISLEETEGIPLNKYTKMSTPKNDPDVVEAILAEQSNNPASAFLAVRRLQKWTERPDWREILPAFARCVRIIRSVKVDVQKLKVNPKKFVEEEEEKLYDAIQENVKAKPSSVDELLNIVVKLIPSINAFFDKVLVMAEDEKIKQNRLALVGRIANLSDGIADLSKLEGF